MCGEDRGDRGARDGERGKEQAGRSSARGNFLFPWNRVSKELIPLNFSRDSREIIFKISNL